MLGALAVRIRNVARVHRVRMTATNWRAVGMAPWQSGNRPADGRQHLARTRSWRISCSFWLMLGRQLGGRGTRLCLLVNGLFGGYLYLAPVVHNGRPCSKF